jgi:CBS-domain-containing membrane protein
MHTIVLGLARAARLPALETRHSSTTVLGFFAFLAGVVAIAVVSSAALVTGQPFVFPSLGPTAFLLFYTPSAVASSPRSAVAGHLIGVAAGYLSLAVFGLRDHAPALLEGVTGARVGAAALSLGLCSAVMVWLRVPHPPACSTTLIVSLGLLRELDQLAVLMLGVVVLVTVGLAINRLAGVDYPAWRAPAPPAGRV